MIRIGINGFGRIGRVLARINALNQRFKLVAVNDINPHPENMAYLFKYDSTYGKFEGTVSSDKTNLIINGERIPYTTKREIDSVDWDSQEVDILIDSSGVADNAKAANTLVKRYKVKKVIVTNSSPHVDREVIAGVNDSEITKSDKVISSSICDANAIAHILKWVDDAYGIETGSVTTVHPWLSYQNLVDGIPISFSKPGIVWKDFALGRASADSLIPKNTTAVDATVKILRNLKDKLLSFSYRVPTDIVASSDLVLKTVKSPSHSELQSLIEQKVAESKYVKANYESLVSIDYEKETASAVIDMQWLKVNNGLIKVVLWYDNEWGYSSRVLDLAEILSNK